MRRVVRTLVCLRTWLDQFLMLSTVTHCWCTGLCTSALAPAGSGGGRCLYVSGVPGTGKTATVLETMRSLRRMAEAGQLPPFQFVEINSLRLPSPQHAYTHLYEVPALSLGMGISQHQTGLLLRKLHVHVHPVKCLHSVIVERRKPEQAKGCQ